MEAGAIVNMMKVPGWERIWWLRHGFTTRSGGVSTVYAGDDLNLGFTSTDDPEAVWENRKRLLKSVMPERPEAELVTARQAHGTEVRTVHRDEALGAGGEGRPTLEGDGLITASPGVLLGIQVADCVPVLIVDPRTRVVAAFHAGWRGTAAGIVELGIERMQAEFGCAPCDLLGAVGPSIRACCYSVGQEVQSAFQSSFGYADELFQERDGRIFLDLAEANKRQMLNAGLPAENVVVLDECTGCARVGGERKYFSHRQEHGVTGRSMGVIGIIEEHEHRSGTSSLR